MCGRYTLGRRDKAVLARELGISLDALADYRPHYNIAPLQPQLIVRIEFEDRQAMFATWGLVNRWAKDAGRASKCINARAETVESRPAYRDAFRRRRCVVPADGFYEWAGPKGARRPIWFHHAEDKLLLFAGLYEAWQSEPGRFTTTYTILTCAANRAVEPVHNRMPVILGEAAADDWMDPRNPDPLSLKKLLVPASEGLLLCQPASPRVNYVGNDDRELLKADG